MEGFNVLLDAKMLVALVAALGSFTFFVIRQTVMVSGWRTEFKAFAEKSDRQDAATEARLELIMHKLELIGGSLAELATARATASVERAFLRERLRDLESPGR